MKLISKHIDTLKRNTRNRKTEIVLLCVIFSIGFFYRFYSLDSVPATGVFGDEAWNGVDAIKTIKNNDFKVFYADNNGREPLLIWILAILHSFLPPSIITLRLASSIIGSITVLLFPLCIMKLFYFLGYDRNKVNINYLHITAIASTCFLAGSLWHINFSRIAFRAILDPFFTIACSLILCITLKEKKKIFLAIFSGAIIGISFYGYGTSKFAFIIYFVLILIGVKKYKSYKVAFYIFVSAAFFLFPIVSKIFHESDFYFKRLSQVSIFSKEDPLNEFIKSFGKLLFMFVTHGDSNPRHNYNSLPQIHPVTLFFVLSTLTFLILRPILIRLSYFKSTIQKNLPINIVILSIFWFFIMVIPSALTFEGQPHCLRGIGLIIPVYLLGGLGVSFVLFYIKKIKYKGVSNFFTILVSSLILINLLSTFDTYFNKHANSSNAYHGFLTDQTLAFQQFLSNKNSPKLLVLENDKHLESEWILQPLFYFMNCDSKSYNITIVSLKELPNKNLELYDAILLPNNVKEQLCSNNCFGY